MYIRPPPPPLFLAIRHFSGGRGEGLHILTSPPRYDRNFIRPPSFTHPLFHRRVNSGMGVWGCKMWPPPPKGASEQRFVRHRTVIPVAMHICPYPSVLASSWNLPEDRPKGTDRAQTRISTDNRRIRQQKRKFRELKNGVFGKPCLWGGTPAIFVIFVVSRGLSSKTLVLLVRTQIRHFRRFSSKSPSFGGTKARFTKSTVSWTPRSLSTCSNFWVSGYLPLGLRSSCGRHPLRLTPQDQP